MSNSLMTGWVRPVAIVGALGIGFALIGALFVRPVEQVTTRTTDIVWVSPEGPPLTLTPVLGRLSTDLSDTGLFGFAPNTGPAVEPEVKPAELAADPRLPALLVLGQKDDRMVAIARLADGSLRTYTIGDQLESGWTISAMDSRRINIERNGERDEILLRAALGADG